MQELIDNITKATGMSDELAKRAIIIVADYLKSKTPKSFHQQIDNMVNGGKLSDGIKEQLMDAAVDMKEKTEDVLRDIADKIEQLARDLKKKKNP